ATWHFSTEQLPAEARGDLFHVERRWFRRVKQGAETTLEPLAEGARLAVGDELEVQLSVRAKAAAEYVHLRDPRAAGLEPDRAASGWRWDLGIVWYEEVRDSGTNFFFEWLPAGEYTLKYRVRAATAGEFRVAPAELQSMYAPEFVAYSAGARLAIAPVRAAIEPPAPCPTPCASPSPARPATSATPAPSVWPPAISLARTAPSSSSCSRFRPLCRPWRGSPWSCATAPSRCSTTSSPLPTPKPPLTAPTSAFWSAPSRAGRAWSARTCWPRTARS